MEIGANNVSSKSMGWKTKSRVVLGGITRTQKKNLQGYIN